MNPKLSQKTLARIHAGAVRFGWSRPDVEKLLATLRALGYEPPKDEPR